jgi:two-component system sensor histidine kinase/response regulator
LQVVICSTYTDISWSALIEEVGSNDNLLILKKPFESIEILQLTLALTKKWALNRENVTKMELLEQRVKQRVKQRTQSLSEATVQQQRSKDSALRADQAKSDFLSNMSHEIRTPMNAILGFAEVLEAKLVDSDHKNYLNLIQTSGKTLLSIINDILDLSKVEAGKFEL